MKASGACTFKITGWDEKTIEVIEGSAKLTSAKVTQSYSGTIEGTSAVEYLMAYTVDGTASFVGLERVTGSVEGKTGTFVIQHTGMYSDKARSTWTIVEGSGTGALATLQGSGSYEAGHSETEHPINFEYSFGS
jgi:hypothetical protein